MRTALALALLALAAKSQTSPPNLLKNTDLRTWKVKHSGDFLPYLCRGKVVPNGKISLIQNQGIILAKNLDKAHDAIVELQPPKWDISKTPHPSPQRRFATSWQFSSTSGTACLPHLSVTIETATWFRERIAYNLFGTHDTESVHLVFSIPTRGNNRVENHIQANVLVRIPPQSTWVFRGVSMYATNGASAYLQRNRDSIYVGGAPGGWNGWPLGYVASTRKLGKPVNIGLKGVGLILVPDIYIPWSPTQPAIDVKVPSSVSSLLSWQYVTTRSIGWPVK